MYIYIYLFYTYTMWNTIHEYGFCSYRFINLFKLLLRGLLEKYPTFGREKETGLLGALDT